MFRTLRKKIGYFNLRRAFRRLQRKIESLPHDLSPDQLLDFVFSQEAALIGPFQVREEIAGLIKFLHERQPRFLMEIGTANGGTLFLLSRVAAPDATLISLDLPFGKYGGGYPQWKIPLYKSFARPRQKLHLLRGDSHSPEMVAEIRALIKSKTLDFLFIDGDHSYEGVKADFAEYSGFAGPQGLIAFHDIVPNPNSRYDDLGVHKFWAEIKNKYDTKEFVKSWQQNGSGIGLILNGAKVTGTIPRI